MTEDTSSSRASASSLPAGLRRHIVLLRQMLGERRLALSLALVLACSLTEGFAVLLLVPLLQAAGLQVEHAALGRIAARITLLFSAVGLRPTLVSVLTLFVGVSAGQALLTRWQTVANGRLCHDFAARLRERLYRAIAGANWLFLSRRRSSAFTHVLTSEIDRVGTATFHLLGLAAAAAVAVVYVLVALRVSVPITLLVFVCGGLLLWLVSRRNAVARAQGERASACNGGVYRVAIEHLSSMKTTRSYGAEQASSDMFARSAREVADAYVGAVRVQAGSRALFDIGSVAILAILVVVSMQAQKLPAATVFLLLFVFARIMPRVASVQYNLQQYLNLLPSFDAVWGLQQECEEQRDWGAEKAPFDSLRSLRAGRDFQVSGPEADTAARGVRLDRVSFRYDASPGGFGIEDVSLEIPAGLTTALIGPSGSGKSTIADLVIGLLTPSSGRIAVDGVTLKRETVRAWRHRIGYVPQDAVLFHESVRANLAWAKPDATEAEMREALRLAAADELVAGLPQGLDTIVGDRGMRLSGGERQRIALARALVRKPSLVILDEATSAIDAENERRILDAIGGLHGSVTIFVITHRLASVRGADKIYVLEHGRLTESGTWDALNAMPGGRFRALCQAQSIDAGSIA